jgi:hypothetical protein
MILHFGRGEATMTPTKVGSVNGFSHFCFGMRAPSTGSSGDGACHLLIF